MQRRYGPAAGRCDAEGMSVQDTPAGDGATAVAEYGHVDDLRPPESWPGAGGRKSVAPDVPKWPSRGNGEPGGSWPGQAKKRSATPGGSWPGKPTPAPAKPATPVAGTLSAERLAQLRGQEPAHRVSRYAPALWALGAGLGWLVPFLAVCGWVLVDRSNRGAEFTALGLVCLAAAAHILLLPRLRYRAARWEVTDDALLVQSGLGRRRRVVPLADISDVRTGAGPLERVFGLGSIAVSAPTGGAKLTPLGPKAVTQVAATLRERADLA